MTSKIDFPENAKFVGVGSTLKFNNGLHLIIVSTGFNSVGTGIVQNKGYIKICPVHNKEVKYVNDLYRLTQEELVNVLSTYTVNIDDIIDIGEFLV